MRWRWVGIGRFDPADEPFEQQMAAAATRDEAEEIAERVAWRVLGQPDPEVEIEVIYDRDGLMRACDVLWPEPPSSEEDAAAGARLRAAIEEPGGIPQEVLDLPIFRRNARPVDSFDP